MGAELKEAARHLVDPLEHNKSVLGAVVGGLLGFVVGVAVVLVLASNPIGWAVAATALTVGSLGMAAGEYIGEKIGALFNYDAGDILKGSPNVTIGHRTLAAARVKDPVKCHTGKLIAEGCATISINAEPAVRVGHRTECDGKVKEGCATVKFGGPSIVVLPITPVGLPAWYSIFKEVVDWASFLCGLPGLLKGGIFKGIKAAWATKGAWLRAYKVADAAYEVVDAAMFIPKKIVEGKVPGIDQFAFTQSDWYQNADKVWSGVGTARGIRDAVGAVRAPRPEAPTLHTPEPGATPGWSAQDGGTIVTRDLPAGMTTSPGGVIHADGQIHVENQAVFNGQTYNRSEGGLFLPEGMSGGSAKVPDVAPRGAPPPAEGSLLILPGAAPRTQGAASGPSSALPAPSPRIVPAGPEVPPSLSTPAAPPVPASSVQVPSTLAADQASWADNRLFKPAEAADKAVKFGQSFGGGPETVQPGPSP